MRTRRLAALVLSISSASIAQQSSPPPSVMPGLSYTEPFFPGAEFRNDVPTPDAVLGFPVGQKPATHAQIEAVVKAIAAASPRCRLVEYARSHEGRTLYYLVIASEANAKRLDELQAGWAKLHDPRGTPDAETDRLAKELPALAWMAYVIHGDENSGSDASLAVAHYLAACTDPAATTLLNDVVVIIDPLMNPDGRDRFLSMLAQQRTEQPSVDDQSMLHTGFWPRGRMNHYLFDMNRDWIFATQPETRGRLAAIGRWRPQYFMESHEMGSQDTFLFMPGREAINPNMPANVRKWEVTFANDLASAFDSRGWRYYTGEWNDNWYPGYSSSWAAMAGMIENLYEQASIGTDAVRRPEGSLHTYREAVHKQLVASMANLQTLAKHRTAVLSDYLAERRRACGVDGSAARTFAFPPSANHARRAQLLDLLSVQGFEVKQSTAECSAAGKDRLGFDAAEVRLPAGTLMVSTRQPLGALLAAMFEFDPRMTPDFLRDERRELLRFDRSLIYDITGWSLPMTFDVECFELRGDIPAAAQAGPVNQPAPTSGPTNPETPVAYVINGADDASVQAAGRLMEAGVWVRVADKPFSFGGSEFPRGSVLVTRVDNRGATDLNATVRDVCAACRVQPVGVTTGMGPGDLPDLGGEHFILLHKPRIAVLGREPFGPYSFGQAWYTIDHVLGLRASFINADDLGGADLRRYNVIVLPDGGGPLIAKQIDGLRTWVQAGGTLVAMGGSAAALAKEKDGIGGTRVLSDVLAKPEPYVQAVIREWEGQRQAPDPDAVWSQIAPAGDHATEFPWDGSTGDDKPSDDELKRRDDWRRLFSPAGALLAARVDDRSWLTAGCGSFVPVMQGGDDPLVCPIGVHAPVRFGVFLPAPPEPPKPAEATDAKPQSEAAKADGGKPDKPEKPKPGWQVAPKGFQTRLRMSGLLWPEAAERLVNSAYVTRESVGAGQVILFASDPNFRAATLGTSRIFRNAVVYGPGMGASQPIKP